MGAVGAAGVEQAIDAVGAVVAVAVVVVVVSEIKWGTSLVTAPLAGVVVGVRLGLQYR
jgi:hypothetical protein